MQQRLRLLGILNINPHFPELSYDKIVLRFHNIKQSKASVFQLLVIAINAIAEQHRNYRIDNQRINSSGTERFITLF